MATITKTPTEKSIVELQRATKELGYGIETVDMNGVTIPAFAYTSEEDRQAGLRFLQMFMDGSENAMGAKQSTLSMERRLQTAGSLSAHSLLRLVR